MFFKRCSLCTHSFFSFISLGAQTLYGIWKIAQLDHPIVSIFGGSHMRQQDTYAHKAHLLAKRLADAGVSIMTGGGPGIMQAASCGAIIRGKKLTSIGIGVKEINEGKNPCVQEYFELNDFSARKFLLTHYSTAFVIFPGGFGTLDELSEILTLIKTKKLPPVPIVLIGKEYWHYFMKWLSEEAIIHGLINTDDLALFTVTDDLEEAFCLVMKSCQIPVKTKE